MPDSLFIRSAAVFLPDTEAAASAALEARRDTLPRASARRMSLMGLAFDLVMDGESPAETDSLTLATEFGMTRTLEDYLASFPSPSPLAFQNSIHPAGAEQYLVPRRLALSEFLPLAGEGVPLLAGALRSLFHSRAPVRRLLVGEERGTWMSDADCGAPRTFAFRLTVSDEVDGALGELTRHPSGEAGGRLSPPGFAAALAERRPVCVGCDDIGFFHLTWR